MKQIQIIFTLLFAFFITDAHSQSNLQEIKGIIIDSVKKHPIQYVTITVLRLSDSLFVKGTVSKENGNFVANLTEGNYLIRFSILGYKTRFIPVTVILNNNIDLGVYSLQQSVNALEEVLVQADKPIYKLEADKKIYITKNDPSIQSAFAADALQNVPGVSVDANGSISIFGAGASIFVNGHPLKKDNEKLRMYLEQLPASRIEQIEVISNPSAKYKASNTVGIVNFVLDKKPTDDNLVCLGTLFTNRPSYGIFGSYVVSKKKWNFSISNVLSHTNTFNNSYTKGFAISNNDTSYYNELSTNLESENIIYGFDGSFNYTINEKSSIGISSYSDFIWSTNKTKTDLLKKFDAPQRIVGNKSTDAFYNGSDLSVNYRYAINNEGHELYIEAYYTGTHENLISNQVNSYFANLYEKERIIDNVKNNPTVYFSGTYTLPFFAKYQFETGINLSPYAVTSESFLTDTTSSQSSTFLLCDILSRKYTQRNPSSEVWMTFSGAVGKFNYNLGLRNEYVANNFDYSLPNLKIKKTYNNLYPSVHISYNFPNKHSVSASYSRRVVSSANYLSPYIDRTEEEYISTGNPELNQAPTNSFEVNYLKDFNSKINLSLTLYSRQTTNAIASVSKTVFDSYYLRQIILNTWVNASNENFSGANLDLGWVLSPKLRIKWNTDLYYKEISTHYNNEIFLFNHWTWKSRMNIRYKMNEQLLIQFSGNYNSTSLDLFKRSIASYSLNMTLKADFFKNKFTVALISRDLLKTIITKSEYSSPEIYQFYSKSYLSRVFQLTAVWKFGNLKYESKAKLEKLGS